MTAIDDKSKKRIQNVKRGARLRARRESKGIKASWVADKMGIGANHLYYLETGQRPWTDALEWAFLKVIGETK